MEEFIFTFRTTENSISFKVSSTATVEEFTVNFLSLFPGVNFKENTIQALQFCSKDLKDSISSFVDTHKTAVPQLNAIAAFFNRLPEGEPFFLLPGVKADLKTDLQLVNYLEALKGGKSFKEVHQPFEELFGTLLELYQILPFGEQRVSIGEKEKSKRVCRFCKQSHPNVHFEKRAHAISEALGNKNVILLEECDECNEKFSKTIEPDLIEYFAFLRTLYGVKGKGGEKVFQGENFEFKKTGDKELYLSFQAEDEDQSFTLPLTIPLKSNQKISLQNIYRTFCKYVFSVIDAELLPRFERCLQWVNQGFSAERLPQIASLIDFHSIDSAPTLIVYVRKNADRTLPFTVGELRFTHYRYIFIVPFSDQDDCDYIDQEDFDRFWKTFKHYERTNGWKYEQFTNDYKKQLVVNIAIDYSVEAKERLRAKEGDI